MRKLVYLDNAATTKIDEQVAKYINDNLNNYYANPSSNHSLGRSSRYLLEKSRMDIAKILNVKNDDIYFTHNATEANNIVINNFFYHLDVDTIITTKIEHPSVFNPIDSISKNKNNIDVKYLTLDKNGNIDIKELESNLKKSKKPAVSIMHANNEIANINDIKQIAILCKQNGGLFHSDMVQTIGHYDIDLSDIGLDFACFSPHKFHGPKGVGVLYKNDNININPIAYGGNQEKNIIPGTENIHAISAAALSLKIALDRLEQDKKHILNIKRYFISKLQDNFSKDIYFSGNCCRLEDSLYNMVNVSFPNKISLDFLLDINNIAVSKGSVCNLQKYSKVIACIDENYQNRSNIRFSFSRYNKIDEIDYVIEVLKKIFY